MKSRIFNWALFAAVLFMGYGNAAARNFKWANKVDGRNKSNISNRLDSPLDLATDASGNVYMTGYFDSDTADFNLSGPGGRMGRAGSSGSDDAYVVKYDPEGSFLWARQIGGARQDRGVSIAVAPSGSVFVTGYFTSDALDFFTGNAAGLLTRAGSARDMFVAKYDAGGTFLWARNFATNGTGNHLGYAVALSGTDGIVLTGYFNTDSIDFNPGGRAGVVYTADSNDIYLARFDTAGNFVWAKSMGGKGQDVAVDVHSDPAGNIFLTGFFNSDTAQFDRTGNQGALYTAGSYDAFLAKYDISGDFLWVRQTGGVQDDRAARLAVTPQGEVFVAGDFQSDSVSFGSGINEVTLFLRGISDAYLAKYDASGNFLWSRALGGAYYEEIRGLAVNGAGSVYLAGHFNSADFVPGGSVDTIQTLKGYDIFLAKYDAYGSFLWVTQYSGTGGFDGMGLGEYALALALDEDGYIFMAGYAASAVMDFNPGDTDGKLLNGLSYMPYLIKLSCNDSSSAVVDIVTCAAEYTYYSRIFSESGTYTVLIENVAGCDSVVTLNLRFYQINPYIIPEENFLQVSEEYASYQWLFDNVPIAGATGRMHEVGANGDYRVVVTDSYGCVDTSGVYLVNNLSVSGTGSEAVSARLFPNPANGTVYIEASFPVGFRLLGLHGNVIMQADAARSFSVAQLPAGVYQVQIISEKGVLLKTEKLLRL